MVHQKGIHHISVLAGDPQRNADFYVNKLGLRMVKKSVNQDDPGHYHLFYGNQAASPGASLTFFPWPHAHKGEPGTGEAVTVAFSAPEGSLDFWEKRLDDQSIPHGDAFTRFGHTVLRFEDPDGLALELVFEDLAEAPEADREGSVPAEHAIRGFYGTKLQLNETDSTAEILEGILGFGKTEQSEDVQLFTSDAPIGGAVIIEKKPEAKGKNGRGSVHHVAFRAADRAALKEMRFKVLQKGLHPTEIIDRHWFKSVYFRTPAGVLFEMATDGPGYAVDEDPAHLGEKLVLPPWLEERREEIEAKLPDISL